MHVVRTLAEEGLCLVGEHPAGGLPDVLVHRRRDGSDHPAVTVAVAHLGADGIGLLRIPELIPALLVEVSHDLFVLGAVAGHDIAIRVDEERVEGHVAGKQARLAVDVVDEAVVEVGAEPLLGAVGLQELVHQILEVLRHHRTVVDDVMRLHEVEAVVQTRRGELHAQLVGELVERHEVPGVSVLHRHTEAHVRVLHLHEPLQSLVATLEAVGQAADLVVGVLQALDGDADADLGELLAEVDDAVGEEAVGGDDDAVALLVELAHDVLQVRADEGLPSRDVREVHARELLYRVERELLLWAAWRLVTAAHVAPRVAPVRDDDGSVELLV